MIWASDLKVVNGGETAFLWFQLLANNDFSLFIFVLILVSKVVFKLELLIKIDGEATIKILQKKTLIQQFSYLFSSFKKTFNISCTAVCSALRNI